MPRIRRLTNNEQAIVYHMMSRTALYGFPIGDSEKRIVRGQVHNDHGLGTLRRWPRRLEPARIEPTIFRT
ncbi:MAG: hypothetical protein GY874_17470 [Desulfobacteraceae bacterium]|nr:hypothetical protein [Desulfobacteraceae bacterium]